MDEREPEPDFRWRIAPWTIGVLVVLGVACLGISAAAYRVGDREAGLELVVEGCFGLVLAAGLAVGLRRRRRRYR